MRRTLGAPCGNSPFLRGLSSVRRPRIFRRRRASDRKGFRGRLVDGGRPKLLQRNHSWTFDRRMVHEPRSSRAFTRMVCLLSRPYDLRARRLNRPLARRVVRACRLRCAKRNVMHARHRFHGRNGKRTLGRHCACRLHAPRRRPLLPRRHSRKRGSRPTRVFVGLRPCVPRQCRRSRFFGRQCARRCNHCRDIPQYRYHTPGCLGRCLVRLRPSRGIPARWRRTHHHRATTLCDSRS